jgi:hypothetical protein
VSFGVTSCQNCFFASELKICSLSIANCLDKCITNRSSSTTTDPRLTSIVSQVLDAGAAEPSKLRAGLALSLRDFDALEEAVRDARKKGTGDELLRYVLAETTGGASGNEGMDVGFMTSVGLRESVSAVRC